MRADDVLDLIDSACEDWEVGPDAMRSGDLATFDLPSDFGELVTVCSFSVSVEQIRTALERLADDERRRSDAHRRG